MREASKSSKERRWPDWEEFSEDEQRAIAVSWFWVALAAFVFGIGVGILLVIP